MKYNPNRSFKSQTQKVKDYILNEVVDITATPKSKDNLGRPSVFEFSFTDETGANYLVTATNHYIDNRSWRLHNTEITVTPKTE